MGFRFRRQLKIFPGVRINMSKNHPISSITIGSPRSLIKTNIPVGRRGPATTTIGNLGGFLTGVSYTHYWDGTQREAPKSTECDRIYPSAKPPMTTTTLVSKKAIVLTVAVPAGLIALVASLALTTSNGAKQTPSVDHPVVQDAVEPQEKAITDLDRVVLQCRNEALKDVVNPETVQFSQPTIDGDVSSTFSLVQRSTQESFGGTLTVDTTCEGSNGVILKYDSRAV